MIILGRRFSLPFYRDAVLTIVRARQGNCGSTANLLLPPCSGTLPFVELRKPSLKVEFIMDAYW